MPGEAPAATPQPLPGFDAGFYAARYPESAGTGPLAHFLEVGRHKGYAPTARHEGPTWKALAPSLREEDLPAALTRWPEPFDLAALREAGLFDAAAYAAQSGLEGPEARLLVHYLTTGWRDGLDPSPAFSTSYYLETCPDVRHAGINPLVHYLKRGAKEGRRPAPPESDRDVLAWLRPEVGGSWIRAARLLTLFDADFYRDENPEIGTADPLRHFMEEGWRKRRDPSPTFSIAFYLTRNPEAARARINPLVHFVVEGEAKRLRAHPRAPISNLRDAAEREAQVPAFDFYERVRAAFDHDFYARNNRDVVSAGADGFDHYLVFGWREGRDPAPGFSTRFYLDDNPELAGLGLNPFVHYVLFGKAAGRPGTPARQPGEGGGKAQVPTVDAEALLAVSEAQVATIAPLMDNDFYLKAHPEMAAAGADPARHYLAQGWRAGYDPSPRFSTAYYLAHYPDIGAAGIPPLLHYARSGEAEGREVQNYVDARRPAYAPLVSVIVPNYNHARFLPQRMASIAGQTYKNIEIVFLDDCSSDRSYEVIKEIAATLEVKIRLVFNTENSGNVFAQWRKGLELAEGELVWICESDDFCEPDFLARLVPRFADPSVSLAFGRIQLTEADGTHRHGLDAYRERAEAGIWDAPLVRPAAAWFAGALGVSNVIANVGGALMRNRRLPEAVWQEASRYRICGDYFLYLHLAGGGRIAYDPAAVAYFRQHEGNTSVANFDKAYFYEENVRVLTEIARHWDVPPSTRERFLDKVRTQHARFAGTEGGGDFDATFGTGRALARQREVPHVLVLLFAFTPGGGELFPINLANELCRQGVKVSMAVLSTRTLNEDMMRRVDPGIPVYQAHDLIEAGRGRFLEEAGVSVLHSHMVRWEWFLVELDPSRRLERPLIVTLHGSYFTLAEAPEATVSAILESVSRFVYTADRNLEFFHARGIDTADFIKMENAMPADPRPAPFTRKALGIGADDVVFTLVARGVKGKGWRAAVTAFRALREEHGLANVHLLMVGEGEAEADARRRAEGLKGVHFLGYRSEINGILRLADVLIVPTRYDGESYPLIVVQALQEGRPVVATDLGEIGAMVTAEDGAVAGVLLPYLRDSEAFIAALTAAMLKMTDPARRRRAGGVARRRARHFDMTTMTRGYIALYEALAGLPAAMPAASIEKAGSRP